MDDSISRIELILQRNLGEWVAWSFPEYPPNIGLSYRSELSTLANNLGSVRSSQRKILLAQDVSDLFDNYETDGSAKVPDISMYWKEVRQKYSIESHMNPIFRAGIGDPKYCADFEYWSRMEHIELKEALWLSLGLDPRTDWQEVLVPKPPYNRGRPTELKYAQSLLNQLERFSQTQMLSKRFKGPELLQWIRVTGFPAVPNFIEMLEEISARRPKPVINNLKGFEQDVEKMDPRAKRSASKIITALAISELGYVPNAKRSPIANEIEGICIRAGLGVSSETIREFIRTGEKLIRKEDEI